MSPDPGTRSIRDVVAPGLVVLLIYAGYFKGSPALAWVPVDLTLLAVVGVGGAVAVRVLSTGRVSRGAGWLVALGGSFAFPAFFWTSDTMYAAEKVQLLLVTAVAAAGGLVLLSTRRRVWWFLRWFVLAGVAMAVLTVQTPAVEETYGRVVTEGGNTIALGRAMGAGLLVVTVLAIGNPRRWLLIAGLLAALFLSTLVGSGSRGPVVAAAVVAVVMVALRPDEHRMRNTVAVAGLGAAAGWWALTSTGGLASNRIIMLFEDDRGASVDTRLWMYEQAEGAIWKYPLGMGWGGLYERLYPLAEYPHNIVLEVFGEAGWIAGLVLLAALTAGLRRSRHLAQDTAALGVFALLLFFTLNAMVSGDVNDNRTLFALLGAALALPHTLRRDDEQEPATASPDGPYTGSIQVLGLSRPEH